MSRRRACVLVPALLFLTVACADPPSREMNQAQGAIDAARAAGAEKYAATELAAAVDALQRSHDAVAQNDYRLALSLAIDSRERAQAAARTAGETRAQARGDAERVVTEATLLLSQALERLEDPALQRAPRRALADPREALAAIEKTMQEARAAMQAEDYDRAIALTTGVSARIQEVSAALDKLMTAQAARPRRGR